MKKAVEEGFIDYIGQKIHCRNAPAYRFQHFRTSTGRGPLAREPVLSPTDVVYQLRTALQGVKSWTSVSRPLLRVSPATRGVMGFGNPPSIPSSINHSLFSFPFPSIFFQKEAFGPEVGHRSQIPGPTLRWSKTDQCRLSNFEVTGVHVHFWLASER
jgi:hypothetical protein